MDAVVGKHPRILFVGRRGANRRHLRNIIAHSDLPRVAQCELYRGTTPGVPALDAGKDIPLEEILAVHLSKRNAKYPWLFRHGVTRQAYLKCARFFARWLYRSWFARLRRLRPDAVVLWNGHRIPESGVRTAAEALDIPVIHVENGCLPGTRTVDPVGVNAFNCVPRDPVFFRHREVKGDRQWRLVARALHRTKSADEVHDSPRVARARLPERYVFVPFQVDTDSQLVLHSPHVADMRELFGLIENAVEWLNDRELVFLFKEHPTSPYRYSDLHRRCMQHPRLQFCNSRSTQELIEGAETVVTINSTVGIESLLFRKRVVTLGDAFYNIDSLVRRAASARELARLLDDRDWQPDDAVRRGFIDYLDTEYCVPMRETRDDWQAMADRILALTVQRARAGTSIRCLHRAGSLLKNRSR